MFQTNQYITTCCSRSMGVYLHMTCWSISWSIVRTIPSLYLPRLCYVTFLWTNPSGRAFFCDTGRGLLGRSELNLHGPSQNSLEQLGHSRFRHLRQYNLIDALEKYPTILPNFGMENNSKREGGKKKRKPKTVVRYWIYNLFILGYFGSLTGAIWPGPCAVPRKTTR